MIIDVSLTQKGSLSEVARSQIPFATSKAINRTILDIQFAQRVAQKQAFTIRRPDFADRAVKINRDDFARRDRLVGRVGYQGPSADILTKFEAGGVKRGRTGGRIAIPVDVKRNKSDIVTRAQLPRRLLENAARTRAFILRTKQGRDLIFQRLGKGKRSRLRLLYALARQAPIPAQLDFLDRATRTVRERYARTLTTELAAAIRTAR